jgi:hypothetical protein
MWERAMARRDAKRALVKSIEHDKKEQMTRREAVIFEMREYIGSGVTITNPDSELDYVASLEGPHRQLALYKAIHSQLIAWNIKPEVQKLLVEKMDKLYVEVSKQYQSPVIGQYKDYINNFKDVEKMNDKVLGINVNDNKYIANLSSDIEDYKLKLSEKQELLKLVKTKETKSIKKILKDVKLKSMADNGTLVVDAMETQKQQMINSQLDAIYSQMGSPLYSKKQIDAMKVKPSDYAVLPKLQKIVAINSVHDTQPKVTVVTNTVTIQVIPEITGRKFKK